MSEERACMSALSGGMSEERGGMPALSGGSTKLRRAHGEKRRRVRSALMPCTPRLRVPEMPQNGLRMGPRGRGAMRCAAR